MSFGIGKIHLGDDAVCVLRRRTISLQFCVQLVAISSEE